MIKFKETFNCLRFHGWGSPTFSRRSNFSKGVQLLIPIETYKIYDFPEGADPLVPPPSLWIRA